MPLKLLLRTWRHGVNIEALCWIAGLIFLAAIDPYASQHLSFCPLHNLGFDFCPGCGLGRSISLLFHGDVGGSFRAHPLGIPALVILLARIGTIWYRTMRVVHIQTTGGSHG